MKKKLSKEFSWKCQNAVREKKGRAKGGIITGIRKRMEEIGIIEESVNDVQERRIRVEGKIWRVITVYNGERMKIIRQILEEKIRELEEEMLFIGGDFNAKIGLEGEKYEGVEGDTKLRENLNIE